MKEILENWLTKKLIYFLMEYAKLKKKNGIFNQDVFLSPPPPRARKNLLGHGSVWTWGQYLKLKESSIPDQATDSEKWPKKYRNLLGHGLMGHLCRGSAGGKKTLFSMEDNLR